MSAVQYGKMVFSPLTQKGNSEESWSLGQALG